ncbi:glutamate-cysteine ligase family protein [Haloechinothrix salitolerans]|uniref:Glutamate--cysteine ligase EgtA n=1 Tax=Haloechinothrix salitolerans TaxID=926830 RepID=A0ABW2C2P4_9PSEU
MGELSAATCQRPCDIAAEVISDRAAGEAYVASVCFKHGPPERIGVELEYTVHHRHDPVRPVAPSRLASAIGPHAPRTLRDDSPAKPLPSGSVLTVEPGGQLEISTPPLDSLSVVDNVAERDLDYVTALLARYGLVLGASGSDPHRPPVRVLGTPRYAAMERRFARRGGDGITMMCATAAIQVSLDAGEAHQFARRWAALHAMGPPLLAMFANSRRLLGRDTGYASARWLAVMGTEPARTAAQPLSPDPAADWARRVMDTPLMVLRDDTGSWDAPPRLTFAQWIARGDAGGRRPTYADLDYHLTTLFTPVRPRGHLEVRYLDAQPRGQWLAPVAMLAALLHDDATTDAVLDRCAPALGLWQRAARAGLADPELARIARSLVDVAMTRIDRLGLAPPRTAAVAESWHRKAHRREEVS